MIVPKAVTLVVGAADVVTVTITNLPGYIQDWRPLVEIAARGLRDRLAQAFEEEQYGGGALGANTPEYERMKDRDGWDARRGHKSGELQDAMWEIEPTVRLTRDGFLTRATIEFRFSDLVALAEHAEWYQQAKAAQGLLTLKKAWVNEVESALQIAAPAIERRLIHASERAKISLAAQRKRKK